MTNSLFRSVSLVCLLAAATLILPAGCRTLTRVSEKEREVAISLYKLGQDHFYSGRVIEAIQALTEAEKHNPDDEDVHNLLGLIFLGRDDFERAENHFRQAIEIKPDFSDAWNNLGSLHMARQQWSEALLALQRPVDDVLYPFPHLAHFNTGWCHYQLGDYQAALKHLEYAVSVKPEFCKGHNGLGIVYLSQNLLDPAIRAFDDAVARCPDYTEPLYRRGLALMKRGDSARARSSFEQCRTAGAELDRYRRECQQMLDVLK